MHILWRAMQRALPRDLSSSTVGTMMVLCRSKRFFFGIEMKILIQIT
jgi:hypothetical protein